MCNRIEITMRSWEKSTNLINQSQNFIVMRIFQVRRKLSASPEDLKSLSNPSWNESSKFVTIVGWSSVARLRIFTETYKIIEKYRYLYNYGWTKFATNRESSQSPPSWPPLWPKVKLREVWNAFRDRNKVSMTDKTTCFYSFVAQGQKKADDII